MTHAQLVGKAVEWLRRYGCGIVLSEQTCDSLHSTTTERQAPFQPIASGTSPLTQVCSERTIPQPYRRSHSTAFPTS